MIKIYNTKDNTTLEIEENAIISQGICRTTLRPFIFFEEIDDHPTRADYYNNQWNCEI